jgi:hypothetical protein
VTPDEVSLWIVSFRRLDALRDSINGWLGTFDFREVNVIVNDPTVDYSAITEEFPMVEIWPNIFRDPWETGSIAWCWNMCMRHTFEHRDWCLMSQDDVVIEPGWPERITDDFWTYVAPVGDVIQLQSIRGFAHVGWFDERFRAIGGPEADYVLRMLQAYPTRLSAHDEHVWQLRHNDVGLADFWHTAPKVGEVGATRLQYNMPFADAECFGRWIEKWGVHVDELMLGSRRDTAQRRPGWDEIDWYPAFTRHLQAAGRL